MEPLIKFRPYQKEAFSFPRRRALYLWRRQGGKSHLLASQSLDWMMAVPGDLVTIISASIVLGTEVLLKEARLWAGIVEQLRTAAARVDMKLTTNVDGLDFDAIADTFAHSKLETKLWHDSTTCSRTRVIAPNPDTAVGWTGNIIGDEIGRWPEAQDTIEAIEPFMSSNPRFKLRYATTPPPDDKHYTFELFAPPPGLEFAPNPRGNWYQSTSGIPVHRVDAWDAHAALITLYHPDTGAPLTPEEHRSLAMDKAAWDRNYALRFVTGGTAAVSLASIARAMEQGKSQCAAANITEEVVP